MTQHEASPNMSKSLSGKQSVAKAPPVKGSVISLAFKNSNNVIVDLKGKNISDTHINELAKQLKSAPMVRFVDLSANKITDDGVQHLAKAICETYVESLNLSSNKLTEKCTEPLAAILRTNKNLKVLDLQNNNITNRVFRNKIRNSLTWMDVKF
jgi:Ran GTPase-activating protein (RanGAP) involved in mRNA processing and transport